MSLEGRGDDLLLLVRGQLSLTDFEPLGTPSHVETLSMQGIPPSSVRIAELHPTGRANLKRTDTLHGPEWLL